MNNTLQDDFEGISCCLVHVFSWNLLRRTEENREERQSR